MKISFKICVLALTSCLLTQSCAKVFYSPDAKEKAKEQSVLAILPPSITISSIVKTDPGTVKEVQRSESLNFQKEIYAWLLKRQMKMQFNCEFQEPHNTNAILKKAGYPEKPLTTEEICDLLRVDGLIKTNFGLSKPLSVEGAVVAIALFSAGAPSNIVQINYTISDCISKKLIFSYDRSLVGGFSSIYTLVDKAMKQISKKMPHYKNQ